MKELKDFGLSPAQHRALDVLLAEAVEIIIETGGKMPYMDALELARGRWESRLARLYNGTPNAQEHEMLRQAANVFHANMQAAATAAIS